MDYNNLRYTLDADTGTLRIRDARPEDSARYVCNAANGYGKDAVAGAFVDVREATRVTDAPRSAEFVAGGNYTFPCGVEVDERLREAVNVTWTKDGRPVAPAPAEDPGDAAAVYVDPVTHTLSVTAAGEADVGEYACHVRTPVDEITIKATLYKDGE